MASEHQTTIEGFLNALADVQVDLERVEWCLEHDIDPYAQCADGPCEAWQLVTEEELATWKAK